MRSLFRPLRQKTFKRLWPAQICNITGYWIGDIALAVLVFDKTRSPLATAALFLANLFAPALISPMLIARVDALPVRQGLLAIFMGQAGIFGVLAALTGSFSLPLVLTLVFVAGILAMMAKVLIRSTTALILRPIGELRAGNALLNVSSTWGSFIVPAVAGVLVAVLEPSNALLLGTGVFLSAGVVLLGDLDWPVAEADAIAWRKRFSEGIRYIRQHNILKPLLIAAGAVIIFTDIVWPLEVILVKGAFGGGDAAYGVFVASWGAGAALGGLWFAAVRSARLHVLLFASLFLMGGAFIGIAVAPNLVIADAAQVVGGFANGFQTVALYTIVQEMTSDAFQARVQSLLESVISSTQGVGFVLGGSIAAIFSARCGFFVAGAGTVLVGVIAWLLLRSLPWTEKAEAKVGSGAGT